MEKETVPTQKSERELKYEAALETIAGGSSWETVVANSVLAKKEQNRQPLKFMGNNLAAIASLVIAISGVIFGILQVYTAVSQKDKETRIAKVEALQKLIPSLTSDNANSRRYAVSALLTLYSSSNESSSDKQELASLAENISGVGDAETLEALARKLNDLELKKKASDLYAIRGKQSRREAQAIEGEISKANEARLKLDVAQAGEIQQKEEKVRLHFNAAWDNTERALSLNPDNANAMYELGSLLRDTRGGDRKAAGEKFSEVIRLIDEKKYPRDNELYVRSYLNKTVCLYLLNKQITTSVCESYKLTKSKYREFGMGELDVAAEELEELEAACR